MSLKLRVRKDITQLPQLRWRVEVASRPVGEGASIGESSWVDAMVTAGNIRRDAEEQMSSFYAALNR